MIRTVTGDVTAVPDGAVYPHEHLFLDSPLIKYNFPGILLNDLDAAVSEVGECRAAGVSLMVDAMTMSAGRDVARLAEVSRRTGMLIIAATGLHHDRYYGSRHWTNRIASDVLVDLFIADLVEGIDDFDYTGPVIQRSDSRAGVVKVATSSDQLTKRDERNLRSAAAAAVATGAPLLTHCEGGWGGILQVTTLTQFGVPASSIILSHVDKTGDRGYLRDLAQTGALLEFDRGIRQELAGEHHSSFDSVMALITDGFEDNVCVSNDGALREFWHFYGGSPGLAWLANATPGILRSSGATELAIAKVTRENALRALTWRDLS